MMVSHQNYTISNLKLQLEDKMLTMEDTLKCHTPLMILTLYSNTLNKEFIFVIDINYQNFNGLTSMRGKMYPVE